MLSHDAEFQARTKLTVQETTSLMELCLSRCYFLWEEEFHVLENSGPVGLSLMVVVAEAFLQYHENRAFQQALYCDPPIELKSFYRYVDDSHARFPSGEHADRFLDVLNQQHPHIQYTIERESEKTLNFLDIKITNTCNGKYEYNIHRKDAITNVQIKPNSSHNPTILRGVFKGFVDRAFNICSDNCIEAELNFLVNTFVENGYSKQSLQSIITSCKQQKHNQQQQQQPEQIQSQYSNLKLVKLPWIPELSIKFKKIFKKAGYKAVLKSGSNLQTLLT